MKVLVCGGRDYYGEAAWSNVQDVLDRLHLTDGISLVIEGGASGADVLARKWCESRGIPLAEFPALWGAHGRAAGPRRNEWMLRFGKPDLVVAFPGGRGTAHMVSVAKAAGVKVTEVVTVDSTPRSEETGTVPVTRGSKSEK